MTRVAHLVPESAVTLVRAETGGGLVRNAENSRLEGCKRSPVAAVQREFANGPGIYRRAHRRRLGLNVGRCALYFDALVHGADFERNIDRLLGSDREGDARNGHLKTCRRSPHFVVSRQEVRRRVEAIPIGNDLPPVPSRRVLDSHGCARDCGA